MNKKRDLRSSINKAGDYAGAVGRGLFAGLAGTAIMTVGQMIEMKITQRPGSTVPAEGVEKVMPVKAPKSKQDKMKLAQMTHFAYGTAWGIPLGVMNQAGIPAVLASISHFGAVWGTALTMLPKQNLAPPVTEWDSKTILIDVMHHGIYALAAGLTYHAISKEAKRQPMLMSIFGKGAVNILGLLSLRKFQKLTKASRLKKAEGWYRKADRKIRPQWEKKLTELAGQNY